MDGRKSRYIKEVLDLYREEDAGDLRRNYLNELVEKMTVLNAVKGKFWKSEKSNQNIVMDEKFVKVIDDACKNRSEGCDESIHIQNWWMEQFTAQQSTCIGGIYG